MRRLFWKELKERRLSLFIYCVTIILMIWLYCSVFPSLHAQAQSFNKILESFPEGFKKAFSIEGTGLESVQNYLAIELFSFTWPFIAIMLVISRAGNTLAGEIEKRTIGTLLSQPLSRTRMFVGKYLVGAVSLLLFTVASTLPAIPLAAIYNEPVRAINFLTVGVLCLLFGLAVFSFTLLLSAISSDRSRVYAISGGILLLTYILNIISAIKPSLDNLKFVSIFHYFNATDALVRNQINLAAWGLLAVVTVLCSLIGYWWFNKRDISI